MLGDIAGLALESILLKQRQHLVWKSNLAEIFKGNI